MTLTHQPIVHRLNRRDEIARQHPRMDELNAHAAPLFLMVFGAAAAVIVWHVTEGYRDVAQHRIETYAAIESAKQESKLMERCANQGIVPFDDVMLQCERLEFAKGE